VYGIQTFDCGFVLVCPVTRTACHHLATNWISLLSCLNTLLELC